MGIFTYMAYLLNYGKQIKSFLSLLDLDNWYRSEQYTDALMPAITNYKGFDPENIDEKFYIQKKLV